MISPYIPYQAWVLILDLLDDIYRIQCRDLMSLRAPLAI